MVAAMNRQWGVYEAVMRQRCGCDVAAMRRRCGFGVGVLQERRGGQSVCVAVMRRPCCQVVCGDVPCVPILCSATLYLVVPYL